MRRLCGAALVASIGLALACGGGGSGQGQLATIDATNAENVARSVMIALDLTSDLSTLGGEIVSGDALSAASAAAANAIRIAVIGFVPLAAGSSIGPITVNCDTSGTVTLTGTVADPNVLTVGDHFTGDFAACVEQDALGQALPTLDGLLDMTVVTVSGDVADLFSLTLDLVFCGPNTSSACSSAFTVTQDDTLQFTVVGSVRTAFDTTQPPLVRSAASGSTLGLTQKPLPAMQPVSSVAMRSYQTNLTQDDADDTFQLSGNGRLASTQFDSDPTTDDGEVRYNVTHTLAGPSNAPPSEGTVAVTGGGNSALQIVPVAGFNIDLGTTYPVPAKTYGAASGQTGLWNSVGLGDTTLVGLIDGSSRVTLTLVASTASAASPPPAPTTDDPKLLNDEFSSDGPSWAVTLTHLADGDYHVYLYAPSDDVESGPMTVGGVAVGSIPGDPGGTLIEGTSWTSVDVTVSGGTLAITGGGVSTGLAGLQIVPVEDDLVDLEVDTNGDGVPEDTIETSWSCLLSNQGC